MPWRRVIFIYLFDKNLNDPKRIKDVTGVNEFSSRLIVLQLNSNNLHNAGTWTGAAVNLDKKLSKLTVIHVRTP